MKIIQTQFNKFIIGIGFFLALVSCQKDVLIEEENTLPLNDFTMQLNGEVWQPSQIGEEACLRTFHGAWSAVGDNGVQKPFYTISAFRDPQAKATYQSENTFKLQITNLNKTGVFFLSGSYKKDFDSYALFTVNKPDGTSIRYINKLSKPSFSVEVSDIIPLPGSFLSGIAGTFYGTLYNEKNSLDSLTFSRGSFTFKKVNRYNFNHCAP